MCFIIMKVLKIYRNLRRRIIRDIPAYFFCTTPFWIMTVICLIKKQDLRAGILYILNQIKQADEVAGIMRKENIFEEVIIVDNIGIKENYLSHKNYFESQLKLATTYLNI